ncbi:hypothetical protein Esi_0179_0018 [Ectocarpus siliculosus]|uniref:Uncharacterized protein n=1 Tax=Ectocarpus siliculosus TaxID=2880 RepID=D7FND1_ECTSI|nr:hypothetical protein Esi_0179_0018 [Ectocarpus siliculosus]|eukprot:CBJ30185.1 hypothetical protein Esi_0179_0018 [Ectocarpus siliculosus]
MGCPHTSTLEAATATALTAALRVSFSRGGHDWRVMSDACMSLVVLYHITAETTSKNRENWKHLSEDDKNGASLHAAGADGGRELHRRKMGLAVHYLRLAASISLGHRRLSIELDSIASDPLPAAVIDNMPRSALDELAGRGGRGPEDDPLRLSTRGLLQFLRARVHEKSLAAAPVDMLPASVVCQIHALLYRHVPLYREKCCIQASSLHPPSAPEALLSAIEKKTSAKAIAAAAEPGGPLLALKDRFNLLLHDAAQALRSGLVAPPLTGPEVEKETVESKEPPAAAAAPGSSPDKNEVMTLTVENVEAVEGVFNTDIGVDVENEQLCRFLRSATTTTTKISASP